jgi:hypothetical protein
MTRRGEKKRKNRVEEEAAAERVFFLLSPYFVPLFCSTLRAESVSARCVRVIYVSCALAKAPSTLYQVFLLISLFADRIVPDQ